MTALVNVLGHHGVHICVLTETKARGDFNGTVTDCKGNRWRIILHNSDGAAGVGLALREAFMSATRGGVEGWKMDNLRNHSSRLLSFNLG